MKFCKRFLILVLGGLGLNYLKSQPAPPVPADPARDPQSQTKVEQSATTTAEPGALQVQVSVGQSPTGPTLTPELEQRAREILRVLETKGNIQAGSAEDNAAPMLPIFSGHPVLDEIKMCDPKNMTPMQALQAVEDWKKRLD